MDLVYYNFDHDTNHRIRNVSKNLAGSPEDGNHVDYMNLEDSNHEHNSPDNATPAKCRDHVNMNRGIHVVLFVSTREDNRNKEVSKDW